ncbi:condensation domain-containing protein [Streptomyces sp. NBC_00885]|uniref:condensation domain-containing protein n=1 Tax=Streptomyces sp. NBC_00885 TaxID=2975857 RepID=UPI00386BD6DF|nr:condensation domain-containing protein [Streptomyces sp. NBC_00885]
MTSVPASPTTELTRTGLTVAPLSLAQERLWLIDATAPGSPTYHVPLLMRWSERVDVTALRTALDAITARHEVLRTTYRLDGERVVQVVGNRGRADIEVVHGTDRWADVRQDALRRARTPLDLATKPPLRCVVWPGAQGCSAVLLVIHHIAVDGWSLAALFEELAESYQAALDGRTPELPPLPVQYADYAVWDREALGGSALETPLADRADALLAVPAPLRLGGARRTTGPLLEGDRPGSHLTFQIDAETVSAAEQLAKQSRATPFVVFLAAYAETLRRYAGQREFVVGTVTANRPHPALERLIGFFVNTVPLHCKTDGGQTFRELLRSTRAEAFATLTHQRLPFDRLTAVAAARSGRGHQTLVDAGFAFQNMPAPALPEPVRWAPPELLPTGTAKFDVLLTIEAAGQGALGTLEVATDRYPAELGERFAEDFLAVLRQAIADPDRMLSSLPVPHGPLASPERESFDGDGQVPAADTGAADDPRLQQAAALFRAALSEVSGTAAGDPRAEDNFFGLGGNSLLAVTMLARAQRTLGRTVRPRDFFGNPTVAGLAALLAEAPAPSPAPATGAGGVVPGPDVPTGHEDQVRVAGSVQQRLWLLDRIRALRAAYLVPAVVEVTGTIDTEALAAALDAVLAHHPALRSRFRLDRKRRQVTYRTDGPSAVTNVTDAAAWSQEAVAEHVAALCWTPFDLANEAPARAEILLLGDSSCVFVLCAHHIVVDGRSQQMLLDQIATAYRGDPLPPAVHPATSPAAEAAVAERVADAVAVLVGAPTDVALPHDRPRGRTQSITAATLHRRLDSQATARFRRSAAEAGCSPFLATVALTAVSLAAKSRQRDFVFVFPWSQREGGSADAAVEMAVNTVPIRVDLRGEPTWRTVLERVAAAAAVSYRNADVPFNDIVAALHPDRDLSRPALTPVYVAWADAAARPPDLGVPTRLRPLETLMAKYEIEVTAHEADGELEFSVTYLTELFDRATVAALLDSLVSLAARLSLDPRSPADEGIPL